jgi:hypothetical protein
MAKGGLRGYSVQEAQNAGLGQVGSAYLDGTSFTPSSGVVVAITMLTNCTFQVLTPVAGGSKTYISVTGTGYEGSGDTLANTDTFPAGVTIYGRWSVVDVTSGDKCICYIG